MNIYTQAFLLLFSYFTQKKGRLQTHLESALIIYVKSSTYENSHYFTSIFLVVLASSLGVSFGI